MGHQLKAVKSLICEVARRYDDATNLLTILTSHFSLLTSHFSLLNTNYSNLTSNKLLLPLSILRQALNNNVRLSSSKPSYDNEVTSWQIANGEWQMAISYGPSAKSRKVADL